MSATLIKSAVIVNEGDEFVGDVLIKNGRIERIDTEIIVDYKVKEINAEGLHLLPGIIDDQVHFREPGLTHKANIGSEARAAVAGGVTSFMEMPNTKPAAVTLEELEKKYAIANKTSLANYSFYMGGTNDNYEEVMKTDLSKICGLKLFLGSSTGNMLVDRESSIRKLFGNFPGLIATHCEDEETIKRNTQNMIKELDGYLPMAVHPFIRTTEACYLSSARAIKIAKEYGTRLHILHISTQKEIHLFDKTTPLKDKKITSEVCAHHLWFDADDYYIYGSRIKCNPAIKFKRDRTALIEALATGSFDVIATDHAPHTWEEKENDYLNCPSGLPLIQHSLQMMLDFYREDVLPLKLIVEKMCHAPAILFRIKERGFLREGYHADMVLVNMNKKYKVTKDKVLYKCGWSPMEGTTFHTTVEKTFVNGNLVYDNGSFSENIKGDRLSFNVAE